MSATSDGTPACGEQSAARDGPPRVDPEVLRVQMSNAVQARSSQDQVLWTIFGIFWAAQAVLLVALVDSGQFAGAPVGLVITAVGALLSLVWLGLQSRALGHIKRYEELIEELERRMCLTVTPDLAISKGINRESYDKFLARGLPARELMPWCVKGALVIWFLGFIYFMAVLASQRAG